MQAKTFWVTAVVCGLLSESVVGAVRPRPQSVTAIYQFGAYMNDVFEKSLKDVQAKIDVDLEHGVGFYEFDKAFGAASLVALPAKELSEEGLKKSAATKNGVSLCRLFVARRYQLLADGKPIDSAKLPSVRSVSVDGLDKESAVLLCTVRDVPGKGKELCFFGTGADPVLRTELKETELRTKRDFALTWRVTGNDRLSVLISLFDKYSASLEVLCVLPTISPEEMPPLSQPDGPIARKSRAARRNRSDAATRRPADATSIQFDLGRTGYLPAAKSLPQRPRVVWKYPAAGASTSMLGDPIVYEGVVYFGDADGRLHALSAESGIEKWTKQCSADRILAAPVVAAGRMYVASAGDVKCIAPDNGSVMWSRDLPQSTGDTWPLNIGDTLFTTGGDGSVYALSQQNGEVLWRVNLLTDRPADLPGFKSQRRSGQLIRFQSAASDGDTLFQNVHDQSRVVALDCKTGKQRWSYRTALVTSHPAVWDDYVFAGGDDLCLHCIERTSGKRVWKLMTGGIVAAAPAVANGYVYCVACNGRVICAEVDTGKQLWIHRLEPAFDNNRFTYCAPIVTDDTVYIAMGSGGIHAIEAATGEALWDIYVTNTIDLGSYNFATDGRRLFVVTRERPYRPPSGKYNLFAVGD